MATSALNIQKLLALVLLATTTSAVNVPLALAPASEAPVIAAAHVSLSIEGDRWTSWSGTTSGNQFFYNLLDNIKQITGHAPNLRIGADSEDVAMYHSDVNFQQATFPNSTVITPYPEANSLVVGDSYYQTIRFMPPGTHVTWGVNLGANNLTAAYLQTRAIANTFNSPAVKNAGIVLDHIEIGNEPDFYPSRGYRKGNWTAADYVENWTAFANNVSVAAGITPASHTKFMACSFASIDAGLSPTRAFDAGLVNSTSGKLISTISQHMYSGAFCSGGDFLLQGLMDKYTIRSNLTTLVPDIRETRARGLQYVLGETNSYACHGAPGVSNTAGAALWQIDYSLYALQLGVSKLFFHQGIGYKYNMIQPAPLNWSSTTDAPLSPPQAPHIQPQYYAALVVAEAIGMSTTTRVAEVFVDSAVVTGYAFYEKEQLVRAVFVNLNGYFNASAPRGSVHLDLAFAGQGVQGPAAVSVKRLAIDYASDVAGLTWGGQTYETADGRVAGQLNMTTGPVSAGVDIWDSEAILLSFQ
ncbi:hypothetical protein H0H81_007377 [Sphagnurus paluster]|uniref:Beta-glucuronidase C-terminal domain-containing protein n=1 Tax=Sphagnurus paluster TaxID=117069 RepID=A0A9P7KGR1_9AGAR|nr:hypothetical protein H0H81_007377 [Sphagnurus paluster]